MLVSMLAKVWKTFDACEKEVFEQECTRINELEKQIYEGSSRVPDLQELACDRWERRGIEFQMMLRIVEGHRELIDDILATAANQLAMR